MLSTHRKAKKLTLPQRQRCEQWGRANKSDPFAEAVAIAHYKSGVADESPSGTYSATKVVLVETVEVMGVEVDIPRVSWISLRRP